MKGIGEALGSLFSKKEDRILKDKIAKLLKTSPEKLAEFEEAYRRAVLDCGPPDDDLFGAGSRHMPQELRESFSHPDGFDKDALSSVIKTITLDLCAATERVLIKNGAVTRMPMLPGAAPHPEITNEMLKTFPEAVRPQLTDKLMKVDINGVSSEQLLMYLLQMRDAKDMKERRMNYHMFRRGLDILDLDNVMYKILGMNRNSMGHWLPAAAEAAFAHGFFRIPETIIAKVPMPVLQLSRTDYGTLTPSTLKILDGWAMKTFELDEARRYFIKNGVFSSKFDFRNAKVEGAKEVRELGEYLLFIHNRAVMMAGPLMSPSFYGAGTTNEWVVREYIDDREGNPCIYKGLPLRAEYRVFVDFDTDEVLGISPYWEPELMKKRFSEGNDASSPHQRHDYIIYKMHEETLMSRYMENREKVLGAVAGMVPDVCLEGQWSIDIMQNGDDFWLIDMATADTSALNGCVPAGKLKKSPENWIPVLE